jgi:hypothetical protein
MKTPGIIDGLVVAFVISLGAGAASLLLGSFLGYGSVFNLVLLAAALCYLLYLFKRSSTRVGRVVMLAAWATLSLACWFFEVPLFEQVLIQAGFIWGGWRLGDGQHRQPGGGAVELLSAAVAVLLDSRSRPQARGRGLSRPL